MPEIKVRTKGNASPSRKPRVYFTCHPEDFARYFDKICEDIFQTHDVAIYYTEDMTVPFPEADKETDLGSNNLFVVPVTFRLLREPNRAMDSDLAYAKAHNIPILPFMMEPGIDFFYSQPEKFGERQYLNPYSRDTTELSYGEKLKKYLQAVLISDETARQVRAAFDAYIFLSYRKKDRGHANELMRLIHAEPRYRDIAIWYDEFLTPGESFQENIDRILHSSQLMALLVTPNLLEDANFVMQYEYPAARSSGKPILPAEMEATDREALSAKYDGIPPCFDPKDSAVLLSQLSQSLAHLARQENDADPLHNYLIGLAYLEGIDVEINRDRGLELITGAARADLPEAMEKLYNMYGEGSHVPLDYQKAACWAEKLAEHCREQLGEEHPATISALHNLAFAYNNLGQYQKALELDEKVYALRCKVLGEEHPDTLIALNSLAVSYHYLWQYPKALELSEKVYTLHCKILGEKHPDTISALSNLASNYGPLKQHQKALELKEKVYALRCELLGEEHPDTLNALQNLALTYHGLRQNQKALELTEKLYALRCNVLGEEHPNTLAALKNLSIIYRGPDQYQKTLELSEKVYTLYCKILGEEHPDTLSTLYNLAQSYKPLDQYQRARELTEKVYILRCKVLGEKHPATIKVLQDLDLTYRYLGQYQKALGFTEKLYALRCKMLGEEHPDTREALDNLTNVYRNLSQEQKVQAHNQKIYALLRPAPGEDDPDTQRILRSIARLYGALGGC